MKKLLLVFALMAGCHSLLHAQTPADIYKMFSKEKNVVALNINGSFGKMANIGEDIMKEVESVMLLAFNDCDESVKDKFNKEVSNLKAHGYETLVRVNKDDKTVKVLTKGNAEEINELLVVVSGKKPALVIVKGAISRSELMEKSENLALNI